MRLLRRRTVAAGVVWVGVAALGGFELGARSRAAPLAGAAACPVFPASSPWNQRVDRWRVVRNSAQLIATIGRSRPVHPDFGAGRYDGGPIGIPYVVVDARRVRAVRVRFDYASESDPGPYPVPRGVPIEGGPAATGDRHALIIDRVRCRDYELYNLRRNRVGWLAGSGAIFDLRSNRLRPPGWTSADAAGLPILPGLARYEELARGGIDHALRFTAPCTGARYVYPARHVAPTCGPGAWPPMGLRVRLRANVSLADLRPQARAVAVALQRYGMILADNGSPWFIGGAPSPGWDNDDLHTLNRLHGGDFEVVAPVSG